MEAMLLVLTGRKISKDNLELGISLSILSIFFLSVCIIVNFHQLPRPPAAFKANKHVVAPFPVPTLDTVCDKPIETLLSLYIDGTCTLVAVQLLSPLLLLLMLLLSSTLVFDAFGV